MIDISTETQGEIMEFTHSLKTLHPYSVGIRLGISYNYLPNRKKCFLIE
jgi:hypothetical protein